jgi:hypothetical protein
MSARDLSSLGDTNWLIQAGVCEGCGNVTAIIIGGASAGKLSHLASDQHYRSDRVVRAGADWRPLVAEALTEMHRRSRRPISPDCFKIYGVRDYDFRALAEEVLGLLSELAN